MRYFFFLAIATLSLPFFPLTTAAQAPEKRAAESPSAPDEAGLIRLSKDDAVWIHPQRKLVVVEGEVAFRDGFLEMFACPEGTKEHESLIAVKSKAYLVHAALLAVGAEPGRGVQFNPEYRPAEGPIIDIHVLWRDAEGKKHAARAQEWVRNTKTQEEMEQDWVFAGSGFWTDEETGKRHYYAEQGDLICLSNFATATLDLPIESSQANSALLFEAFTERVPPQGTPVRLVLIPRRKTAAKDNPSDEAKADPQPRG
ncbi:MAG: hypothetical protein KY475_03085 [Planctomycetes bacterium]|nr:hypothetical protein [Planctomycetota bacterium]